MSTNTSELLGKRIETIVVESDIQAYIQDRLDAIRSSDDLVKFFRRFSLYNQPFPAGVAYLAALLHVRADRFVDLNEEVFDNADRSSLIASNVIFAAEDEFAGPDRKLRTTHRSMAQSVLRAAMDFAGWSVSRFNTEFVTDRTHEEMTARLSSGYRIGTNPTDSELFRALGFHLGSERLADIEFCSLDDLIRKRFPLFVAINEEASVGHDIPIYSWVVTHTSVEVDHYQYSLTGAGQSIDYYSGREVDKQAIPDLIIEGFQEFVAFQRVMFEWLKPGVTEGRA